MASGAVPPDVHWVPLGTKRAGMLAVAVAATTSLVLITSLGAYLSALLLRHRARSKADRVENETRAIRFITSSNGISFVSLLAGDLCQALGFSLNFHWVIRGALPSAAHPTALCTTQAIFIQVGDIGSAFSSLIIAANLFTLIYLRITPSRWWLYSAIAGAWILTGILAGVGPAVFPRRAGREPFYGPAGGWCWMNSTYQSERLTLHYLWVFAVAGLTLFLYSLIATRIWLRRRQLGSAEAQLGIGTTGVAKIMMIYPLVYVMTILPLSLYRCAAMAHHTWPIHYALGAGFIFTLSGAADCTVYALTRHIVSLDGIGSALRRGSGSGSHGRSVGVRRISVFTTHRPSLDPTLDATANPPKRPFLPRLRSLFHSDTSSAAPTSTFLGAVHVQVETDVALPLDSPAAHGLREYAVQWDSLNAPGTVGIRRQSGVSPLERPFGQLDEIELEDIKDEDYSDVGGRSGEHGV